MAIWPSPHTPRAISACLLFPIPDSRFPTPDSRFPTPDSRFPTPDSLLPAPNAPRVAYGLSPCSVKQKYFNQLKRL
ncbi:MULTISPECIES: hypothetical protein [unclassified Moorena]|uniref:hypothetical protein n=1 Tax=unclassified Moorena TaxID=2683338 RepID=UPI0013BD1879|nr:MULTISPECIES: hypothetical protein [unclassified Moorena]NEP31304.1 hypothetical protein [Moorena sp. SIO3B2]NEQ09950.1 hypothetical protein [Moorena sp. SIO4E2]